MLMKRTWLAIVIAIVLAVAGFAVIRIHGIFGVDDQVSAATTRADDVKPFNPKQVTLEVFGPEGAVADINYLDVDAVPQRVDRASLPWEYSVSTTAPAVSVNVVAQGDGAVLGCRITVNGDIKDQRTATGTHAQAFCLVKSA